MIKRFLSRFRKHLYEYGIAGPHDFHARRNRKEGNVQFILWKAGEHGHKEDYWHDMDSSWWKTFKPYIKTE